MVFCRATTLVARVRDGQKYTIIAVFFNPFPFRDFPYLTTFAGAEKDTLRLLWSEKVSFCSSVLRSNIGELSSYARLRG